MSRTKAVALAAAHAAAVHDTAIARAEDAGGARTGLRGVRIAMRREAVRRFPKAFAMERRSRQA
jgi:hypothetical protein